MKKMLLILSLMLVSNSNAFESDTYGCVALGMKVIYVLKPNGRVKAMSAFGTERGSWMDDDVTIDIFSADVFGEDETLDSEDE